MLGHRPGPIYECTRLLMVDGKNKHCSVAWVVEFYTADGFKTFAKAGYYYINITATMAELRAANHLITFLCILAHSQSYDEACQLTP